MFHDKNHTIEVDKNVFSIILKLRRKCNICLIKAVQLFYYENLHFYLYIN